MNKKICYSLTMVVSLFAASANGAPMAYSVNSDGQDSTTWDSLYRIDLETGAEQRRGPLFSGAYDHFDTEGLAVAPDGTLWGIDDSSRTLFPIDEFGSINFNNVINFNNLFPSEGGNDFGMTFSCDNSLYVTSVATNTLYQLGLDGSSISIGSLGQNISAIAAIGNPTKLYGLGNGQFENGGTDSPNLYSIDIDSGLATLIGPLGDLVDPYQQAGMAFDSEGNLWAITDRSMINSQPSQILQIDVDTGLATPISTSSEIGFESLAISPPTSCQNDGRADREDPRIPTLSLAGQLLSVLVLMFTGLVILRRRTS